MFRFNANAHVRASDTSFRRPGVHYRHASSIPISSRDATATTRRALRRRVDIPSGNPQREPFEDPQAQADCGNRRAEASCNGLRWRNVMHRSEEWVGSARGEGSSGEGLSRSAVSHAAHNTSFTLSRRFAPLATAGEVVGLWERRWTPLRRPCGRLSGRRETMNVRRQKTCCLDGASCRRFCKKE
jgi:hypothetical protein